MLTQEGAAFVKKINGVFSFKLTGGPEGTDGVWIVDVKNGSGAVKFGSNGKFFLRNFVFKLLIALILCINIKKKYEITRQSLAINKCLTF